MNFLGFGKVARNVILPKHHKPMLGLLTQTKVNEYSSSMTAAKAKLCPKQQQEIENNNAADDQLFEHVNNQKKLIELIKSLNSAMINNSNNNTENMQKNSDKNIKQESNLSNEENSQL